jgi:hypothetical protein
MKKRILTKLEDMLKQSPAIRTPLGWQTLYYGLATSGEICAWLPPITSSEYAIIHWDAARAKKFRLLFSWVSIGWDFLSDEWSNLQVELMCELGESCEVGEREVSSTWLILSKNLLIFWISGVQVVIFGHGRGIQSSRWCSRWWVCWCVSEWPWSYMLNLVLVIRFVEIWIWSALLKFGYDQLCRNLVMRSSPRCSDARPLVGGQYP